MADHIDLSQILADAREEKLSIGSFASKVADLTGKGDREWPTSGKILPFVAGKMAIPRSGKIGARIVSRMKPGYIYFLADPRTPRHPRYVGSTVDPVERQRTHGKKYDGNQRLCEWKRELHAAGLRPLLVTFLRFDDVADARRAEWRIIERWARRGLSDLNSGKEGAMERFALYCQQFHKRPA